MPTTKHSSLWLFTKSSCSSSSTWAKSITPTKIQKKLLGRGKLGYSATAEQGKKSTFRGASSGARDGTGRPTRRGQDVSFLPPLARRPLPVPGRRCQRRVKTQDIFPILPVGALLNLPCIKSWSVFEWVPLCPGMLNAFFIKVYNEKQFICTLINQTNHTKTSSNIILDASKASLVHT
jgi:hypothetical protein